MFRILLVLAGIFLGIIAHADPVFTTFPDNSNRPVIVNYHGSSLIGFCDTYQQVSPLSDCPLTIKNKQGQSFMIDGIVKADVHEFSIYWYSDTFATIEVDVADIDTNTVTLNNLLINFKTMQVWKYVGSIFEINTKQNLMIIGSALNTNDVVVTDISNPESGLIIPYNTYKASHNLESFYNRSLFKPLPPGAVVMFNLKNIYTNRGHNLSF